MKILPITNGNGRTQILDDYFLTIDTAKHLAMQSQTEKGREYRTYFIQVEKAWNSPDMVMKRALQIADKRVIALQIENNHLNLELAEANKKLPFPFPDEQMPQHSTLLHKPVRQACFLSFWQP